MDLEMPAECQFIERVKERDRVGVWGFGSVSLDVVRTLIYEEIGKEIVLYSRPKEEHPNRAKAWVDDLKANMVRRPRVWGTNKVEDMAGLDVIFVGVGVPRRPGQSRDDLLAINTKVLAQTSIQIRKLYESCSPDDLPVVIYMGNPVATMTWVGYKATGFPRQYIMGQAGNLDSRRICQAISYELGLSGYDVRGVVFGDHGDSMVAGSRFFSVNGIPLDTVVESQGVDPARIQGVIDDAKKGGTHFVNAVGKSASAGPARAACEMLRCVVRGEYEVQPVVAILENEYGLLKPEDNLDSLSFGVPARLGPYGVDKILELPVDDLREQMEKSAALIKESLVFSGRILKEEFGIE